MDCLVTGKNPQLQAIEHSANQGWKHKEVVVAIISHMEAQE